MCHWIFYYWLLYKCCLRYKTNTQGCLGAEVQLGIKNLSIKTKHNRASYIFALSVIKHLNNKKLIILSLCKLCWIKQILYIHRIYKSFLLCMYLIYLKKNGFLSNCAKNGFCSQIKAQFLKYHCHWIKLILGPSPLSMLLLGH